MKTLLYVLPIVVMTCAAPPVTAQNETSPGTESAAKCTSPDQVSWLLGAWQTPEGRTIFRERWVRLSEQTWEGMGQVLDAGSHTVRSEEDLRLVGMSGALFYIAKVEHNERPIAFTASECSETHVVFENPDHDFPKRIAYRLLDSDRVSVDVSAGAGEDFTLEFSRMSE